ncbi:BPSS1780 family membrane protein [Xenorhabdus lircayensis]|uniref:Transmembrane protein n=1 Tax=Xenorhabdus lircayensis TaxID=2763499 RepID=A0ABS0U6W2_9GAMM|nr:BPSS1780 family membrane protein [Xenorhabdus lircayensis]MBI6548526.1 hypothetical protein [Xenorhabdus lircayensis]
MDNQNLEKISNDSTNDDYVFISNGQTVSVSTAIGWIGDAWDFISPRLGMWVLMGIIYGAITLGIALIPYLGFILSNLLEPLFIAGIIAVCETQRTTGKFELERLFYGFQYKFGVLLAVGMVVCGIKLLGYLTAALIDGDDLYQVIFSGISLYDDYNSITFDDGSSSSFLSLFAILISLFLSTAYSWFAPTLIVLNNFNVGKALSTSLNAICKNLLGTLLFCLFIGLLIFVSAIPFLLGLLFTTPLHMAAYYSSYRNVFYKKEKNTEK